MCILILTTYRLCKFYFVVTVCLNLNGTLNDNTKHIINLGYNFDTCVTTHTNSTNNSLPLCTLCKDNYMALNNYYIKHKIDNVFCMDVVDLVRLI